MGHHIAMRGISKAYGNTIANEDVAFDLQPGEVHALLGENGAGKTTLMNILFGMVRPDAGVEEGGAGRGNGGRTRFSGARSALESGPWCRRTVLTPREARN